METGSVKCMVGFSLFWSRIALVTIGSLSVSRGW